MLDLEKIKPEIVNLCQRLKVTRLDLFGSAATDAFEPQSDVDVIAEFDREPGNLFHRFFDFKEGLEKITGRAVNVMMEGVVVKNPYFREIIEQTRKIIYSI